MNERASASLSPGFRLGRYRIVDELGSGGMATVYLAQQAGEVGFRRPVAVKRLHPHLTKELDFVAMFLDEARVSARLRHPHVVELIDVVARDGEIYLVMDFVRGVSLAELIDAARESETPIPPAVVVRIACDFLEGLEAAHQAIGESGAPLGIVHRDVSPHNVLIDTDGRTRIADFGIAKASDRLHQTRAGLVRGKAAYMAPEQLLGENVDVRVDVYAAAVTLWEALVGRRAFGHGSDAEIGLRVLRRPLVPAHEVEPSVPSRLGACLARAHHPSKSERFESALAFAEALEAALRPASRRMVAEFLRDCAGNELSTLTEKLERSLPVSDSEGVEGSKLTPTPAVVVPPSLGRRAAFFGVLAVSSAAALGFVWRGRSSDADPEPSVAPSSSAESKAPPRSASPDAGVRPSSAPSSLATPTAAMPVGSAPPPRAVETPPSRKNGPPKKVLPAEPKVDDLLGQH